MPDAPSTAELAATWVAAGGTALATCIATVALLMQRFDSRRAFAEQVAIWFDGEVKAKNTASLPVSTIDFRATKRVRKLHIIPKYEQVPGIGDGQSTLMADSMWTIVSAPESLENYAQPLEQGEMRLELRFTDPAGRRWLRTWPGGDLKRQRGHP